MERKKYRSKVLACEFCGKLVKGLTEMKHHKMSFHTGERPHVCDRCGKGFVRKGLLTQHTKVSYERENLALKRACDQKSLR